MTDRTAQYLVIIYALEGREGAPVPTGRVAQVIDRSPPAVTEKMQRLAADALVIHEPYEGVELTETGRKQAADLYATHETLCRFFRDVLGLDDYTREALNVAGVVDTEIARRLETTVLRPDDTSSKPISPLPSQSQVLSE